MPQSDDSIGREEDDQVLIAGEVRRRKRAALKAQREAEERQLIAAAEGPRSAKQKALKESHWYEATGTKRPHSPGENESGAGKGPATKNGGPATKKAASAGNSKDKRRRTGSNDEGEEERSRLKGQRGRGRVAKAANTLSVAKVGNTSSASTHSRTKKTTAAAKKITARPNKTALASESESEPPSDPNDEIDDVANSSGEEELDDEDDDVSGMTEEQLRKAMANEVPRDPSTFFDDDHNVEMASVHSGYSRHPSSGASRPPTSESEGQSFNDSDQDESLEEEEQEDSEEPVPSKRKGRPAATVNKPTKKRDMIFQDERPSTVSSRPANVKSSISATTRTRARASTVQLDSHSEDSEGLPPSEDRWPEPARLAPGRLLKQNMYVRTVCREGIKIVERALVTEQAWPELHRAAAYKRQVLSTAAQGLIAKDKVYRVLLKRINVDDSFVKVIGKWVLDRLAGYRGRIHLMAADHIALFQLGVAEECIARVRALRENDVYVYPGKWGITDKGEPIWMTKSSQTEVYIYLNPGLVDLLRGAFFATPTGFGYKFKDYYVSSHPTQPEPELTIPLVALGATALFSAIYEWRDGKKQMRTSKAKTEEFILKSAERFDGDAFKDVYDRHVKTLTELKQKAANTFHSVMSRLYTEVTSDNAPPTSSKIQGNALAILDLTGLT